MPKLHPARAPVVSLWLAALSVCGGCFDDSVPKNASLTCQDDEDCQTGHVCQPVLRRCVDADATIDLDAPRLLSIQAQPAQARDGQTVTLTITTDEPLAQTPALVFRDVVDPGFVAAPLGENASVATLTLSIDATIAEGFFPLAFVALVDGAGNQSQTPVQTIIEVDRTPPQLRRLTVSGDSDGWFSDADHNTIEARLLASEPLDLSRLQARVGNQALSCDNDVASLSYVCSGTLAAAATNDGANLLLVEASDLAGNTAQADSVVNVDLAAPNIVAGSVELLINGDANAPFATTGDRLTVRFLANESLLSAPIVTATGGQGISFQETARQGDIYHLEAIVPPLAVAGTESLLVALSDRFGHTGTVALPLPAPFSDGVRFEVVPPSPCTVVHGEASCTDFDGDGYFGPSASGEATCAPVLADCDDRNPLVFPGALEVLFDDVTNDCNGDDHAPQVILHVDAVTGDDDNDGSAQAPLRSLAEAVTLEPEAIFLAVGDYEVPPDLDINADLYGSLDPNTWQPAEVGRSRLLGEGCGSNVFLGLPASVTRGVDIVAFVDVRGGVLDDVNAECSISIGGRSAIRGLHTRFETLLFALSPGTRISDSTFLGLVIVEAPDIHFLRTRHFEMTVASAGASVDIVNSRLSVDFGGPIASCEGCRSLSILFSNVLGEAADIVLRSDGGPGTLQLLGSAIRLKTGGNVLDVGVAEHVLMAGNAIDMADGNLLVRDGTTVVANNIDAPAPEVICVDNDCIGYQRATLTFDAQGSHILEPTGESGTRGAANGTDALTIDTVVAGDVDGECRFASGRIDAGADQLPE